MVKGADLWEEENTVPSVPVSVGAADLPKGYISPYTQPFPGTPGKTKEPDHIRADPVGKYFSGPRPV